MSLLVALLGVASGATGDLRPHTLEAFNRYAAQTERRVLDQASPSGSFLYLDSLPQTQRDEAFAELRRGDVHMARLETLDARGEEFEVDDGLIHHWLGAVFIPGTSRERTLRLIQDYDRHSEIYGPAVQAARIIERRDDDFQVFMRFKKTKVITVVMDTIHEVSYVTPAPDRTYSISRTSSVREVKEPGERDERILADGEGGGFLWRINSYWRFQERDGGVYIECESISLTRTIPFMVRWLVAPFVNDVPREQLQELLETTRSALLED